MRKPSLLGKTVAIVVALLITSPIAAGPDDKRLDIYWIDVEGGGATLLVTPAGESVLMDAGWGRADERDADRIEAAMRDAGIDRLDYLLASHYHTDHTGGFPALARRVEIARLVDHGDAAEDSANTREARAAYLTVAGLADRRTVRAGDRLPLAGVSFQFVTADGAPLERAHGARPSNPLCRDADPGDPVGGENGHSLGYLLSLGAFPCLYLGDLTVGGQHRLACPENLVGEVDVFQLPHHGDGIAPQLAWALGHAASVTTNGPHKGGGADGYRVAADAPMVQDVWQLHRALDTGPEDNAPASRIANLGVDEG